MTKTASYEEIALDALTAQDLRHEAEAFDLGTHAYRLTIYDGGRQEPEAAEALLIDGRLGIAWGADATWANATGDLAADLDTWLNDGDAWADRN